MGKRDIQTSCFFEENRLFADMVNGYVFEGKQVLVPEKLDEVDGEVRFVAGINGKKNNRDNVKNILEIRYLQSMCWSISNMWITIW